MEDDLTRSEARICRAWIAEHSRSFYLSSLLFPQRVREAAWALYAFCRLTPTMPSTKPARMAGGPLPGREVALRRVDGLRQRLDAAYGGVIPVDDPIDPIDKAFAKIVRRYQIDRALPAALLDGMVMDAEDARYATLDDLYLYCAFAVAATVGLMMTRVMGVSDDVGYLRAADLGVAMQLTNIARDVGEDAPARARLSRPTRCWPKVASIARSSWRRRR